MEDSELSKELRNGLGARQLNIIDSSYNCFGELIVKCTWNGPEVVIVREADNCNREKDFND